MTSKPSHDRSRSWQGKCHEKPGLENQNSNISKGLTWINQSCPVAGLGLSYWFGFEAAQGKEIGDFRLFWDLGVFFFFRFGFIPWGFWPGRNFGQRRIQGWALAEVESPSMTQTCMEKNQILIIKRELFNSLKHSSGWCKPRTGVGKSEIIPGIFLSFETVGIWLDWGRVELQPKTPLKPHINVIEY